MAYIYEQHLYKQSLTVVCVLDKVKRSSVPWQTCLFAVEHGSVNWHLCTLAYTAHELQCARSVSYSVYGV